LPAEPVQAQVGFVAQAGMLLETGSQRPADPPPAPGSRWIRQ
jgi:hypothetical protein